MPEASSTSHLRGDFFKPQLHSAICLLTCRNLFLIGQSEEVQVWGLREFMHRLTARALLVLLLMGTFVPMTMAVSGDAPQHACCMRKGAGQSSHELRQRVCINHECCRPFTLPQPARLQHKDAPGALPSSAILIVFHPVISPERDFVSPLSVRGPPLSLQL